MRRWIMIFLLSVVPFQLVWAAAAPYCAHETKAAAKKHFGHHEHRHEGSVVASLAVDDNAQGSGTYHADCESCHLGTSIPFPPVGTEITASSDGAVHGELGSQYRSHIPSGPERPDRVELTAAARFGGGVEFAVLPA